MSSENNFDVFLSHNSKDKPAVRQLGELLKARGLTVWLDEWELIPGRPWQEALEEIIRTTKAAAVLVGKDGLGPWEIPEMRACLSEFVRRQLPVIPVLLPDAPEKPDLPLFLTQFTWVDLRGGLNDDGVSRIYWGITGKKPNAAQSASLVTSAPKPHQWILVAGSGSHELPDRVLETSIKLGTLLAEAGFGLVCGGWPGVDHVVSRAFAETVIKHKESSSRWIKQVMHEKREPDFSAGTMIRVKSGGAEYDRSVGIADAVVLIGGMGGTYKTGQIALNQGKPVFPLADTNVHSHNDAHKTFHEMMRNESWRDIPNLTSEDFQRLGEPAPAVTDTLISLLEKSLGKQQPITPAYLPPQVVPTFQRTQAQGTSMNKVKILFLAANPTDTARLALDEEVRDVEERINASAHRDSVELIPKGAVRPSDLLQYFNRHQANIIHFSGHGSENEEIILVGDDGQTKVISKAALSNLFRVLKDNIRVVVFNACFSRSQAEAIIEHIDCAIGMNKAIGDEAAIVFATAFYGAIGFGRSVQQAFDQGLVALMLEGIPEEQTPELLVRDGVDASQIILVNPN